MTLEQFVAWDSGDDRRYELVEGVPVAMAPPSARHSRIQANLVASLGSQLEAPCRAHIEYGVPWAEEDATYFQADVAIICEQLEQAQHFGPPPRVVFEVVSRSSIARDRGLKADAYRRLPSCTCVVLVFSDRRRVERWSRHEDHWQVQDFIGDAGEVDLIGVNASLSMEAIYEGTGLA